MNLFALVNGAPWIFGPVTFAGTITFTGSALLADGSAAAPALAFAADTDTGIFRPGTHEIAFATGGTERASFISQGLKLSNVGGSFTVPNVFANGDQDTGLATIGGNQLALVVGGATALSFNNSTNATIGGNLTVSGTGTSSVAGKVLVGTTTDNSTGALEVNGTIVAEQYANFAWRTSKFSNRLLSDSSAYASTISGDAFAVLTNNAERMIVTYSGNVGIATTDVQAKLHVRGSSSDPILRIGYNVAGQSYLDVYRTSVDAVPNIQGGYGGSTFPISIQASGGNLLIGTAIDGGQKLQVAGVVNSSGAGYTNSGYQITNTTASRTTGWFQSNSGTTILRDVTGAADLLSVETSGNATFAGAVIAGTWASGNADKLKVATSANAYAAYFANTASSGGSYGVRLHTDTTTATDLLLVATSGSGGGSTRFVIKANGTLNAPSLPTSSAGLSAGDIWNDGGTLKIV